MILLSFVIKIVSIVAKVVSLFWSVDRKFTFLCGIQP